MTKLKLGKMTSRELAQWFGISYDTYRKKACAKLAELINFAEFEKYHGGVIIKEIYFEEYKKKKLEDDDQLYLKEIYENYKKGSDLSSIAGIARKLSDKDASKFNNIRYRMSNASVRTFGKIEKGERNSKEHPGSYGWKEYVWAIKEDDHNEYRYMTPEEKELYNKLLDNFILSKKEKVETAILSNYEEETFQLTLTQADFYYAVISKFKEKTGQTLARATRHEIEKGAF